MSTIEEVGISQNRIRTGFPNIEVHNLSESSIREPGNASEASSKGE